MKTNKKKEVSNSSERLNELLIFLQTSPNKFAKEIGLSRAQRVYDVLNGTYEISEELANTIAKKVTNINYSWLLTGQGDMLKNAQKVGDISGNGNIANVHHNGKGNIKIGTTADFIEIAKGLQRQLLKKDDQMSTKDEQISAKDLQIAKKDEQIDRLLAIIEGFNKK